MAELRLTLKNEPQTLRLGALTAGLLVPICQSRSQALCIQLIGDLGAGKTTFSRGFINQYYQGVVKSPTYTLVESYPCSGFAIYHFDLYRLSDPEEFEYLGVRDYFAQSACCLIEWPDRAGDLLPRSDFTVRFFYGTEDRQVVLKSDLLQAQQLSELVDTLKLQ